MYPRVIWLLLAVVVGCGDSTSESAAVPPADPGPVAEPTEEEVAPIQPIVEPLRTETITAQDLQRDLTVLVEESMAGRLIGTPGNERAVEFIGRRFASSGVEPLGAQGTQGTQESFEDPFELVTVELSSSNELCVNREGRRPLRFDSGHNWLPVWYSATGVGRGEVVFVGFASTGREGEQPALGPADVRGKIALVLDRYPGAGEENSDSLATAITEERSASFRKAAQLAAQGAAAVLLVRDVHNRRDRINYREAHRRYWERPSNRRFPHYGIRAWTDPITIPVARISSRLASQLLHGFDASLIELAEQAESASFRPVAIPGSSVELTVSVDRTYHRGHNVLGRVTGRDPALRNQVVLIGAHLDHEGTHRGRIYSGADDNGSGTAALLEIAEAMAMAEPAPRRTIVFAAWNAEERGMLGSFAYSEAPRVSLDATVAVLNLDMIGRHEDIPAGRDWRFEGFEAQTARENQNAINVIGTAFIPGSRQWVEQANQPIGLVLRFRYDDNAGALLTRSDQWPFLLQDVPSFFFFTGLHPDYHLPSDTMDKIDFGKLERVTRLAHRLAWRLAEQEERPVLRTSP